MSSTETLHRIVGKAIVNESFRQGILNGKRADLIKEFNLEPETYSSLMSIQANSLSEFARALESLLHPAPCH